MADVNDATVGDPTFSGWYVMVSYWLTGESRAYKVGRGVFDRVKPKRNIMDGSGGWGAWEIAYRLASLDLNDGTVTGGEGMSHTVGINWHWTPNTRVMFNFIFADIDSGPQGAGDLQAN